MDEKEPSWPRQLAMGLAMLLVVAALVGSIVAVIALKAADYVGAGDQAGSTGPEPILPTTGSATQHPPTGPPSTSPTSPSKRPPARHLIRLTVSPANAGTFQRVNLTGTYVGHDGATLQIQRSVGGADGPTSPHPHM